MKRIMSLTENVNGVFFEELASWGQVFELVKVHPEYMLCMLNGQAFEIKENGIKIKERGTHGKSI